MPDIKISGMTAKVGVLSGTEQIEINDAGVTKKVTAQQIAALAPSTVDTDTTLANAHTIAGAVAGFQRWGFDLVNKLTNVIITPNFTFIDVPNAAPSGTDTTISSPKKIDGALFGYQRWSFDLINVATSAIVTPNYTFIDLPALTEVIDNYIVNLDKLIHIKDGLYNANKPKTNFNIIKIGDSNTEKHTDGLGWLHNITARGYNSSIGIFGLSYDTSNTELWYNVYNTSKWDLFSRNSTLGKNIAGYSSISNTDVNNTFIGVPVVFNNLLKNETIVNQVTIHYIAKTGGGILEVKKDIPDSNNYNSGGTVVGTIDTSDMTGAGVGGVKFETFIFGDPPMVNYSTIGLRVVTQSTAGVEILFVETTNLNAQNGNNVNLFRFGQTGIETNEMVSIPANIWQQQLTNVTRQRGALSNDKGLIMIQLGTNDLAHNNGNSLATIKANIKTIVQRTKVAVDLTKYGIMLLAPTHYQTPEYQGGIYPPTAAYNGSTLLSVQMAEKIKEIAIEENVAFLDLAKIGGDYPTMLAKNYLNTLDNTHYTQFFSKIYSNFILDIIE